MHFDVVSPLSAYSSSIWTLSPCTALIEAFPEKVMHSPLPLGCAAPCSTHAARKPLEFLFLAAQILASFLQGAAPKAAGRLVYSTSKLSVTQHSHLVKTHSS